MKFNGNKQSPFRAGEFFRNSLEHLQEELSRIRDTIQLFLKELEAKNREGNQDFSSLFISEAKANSIIRAVCYDSSACGAQGFKCGEIGAREKTISRKKSESLKRGIELRLHSLSVLFSLPSFETDVLLIGLAPELDGRFAKLYAYLQNDLTNK